MSLTDFHTHILPGVDDGSRDARQSLEMLREEGAQGISRVVATPHFYPHHDDPERFLRRRERAYEELCSAMQGESGLPQVLLGAEVYYFHGISDSAPILPLTLNGGKYLLLEMPMGVWTAEMYRELENLYIKQGLIPVIAHLDRYYRPFAWQKMLQELEKLPVRIQVNGSFFLERRTASLALRMLRRGQIHLIGSDCHDLQLRKPNLGDVTARIRQKLGEEPLEYITGCENEIL